MDELVRRYLAAPHSGRWGWRVTSLTDIHDNEVWLVEILLNELVEHTKVFPTLREAEVWGDAYRKYRESLDAIS